MYVFSFIDKIERHEPGRGLTAFFTLKGNEEFLQDHFGEFPVMPGVLMLESLKQAAGWAEAIESGFERPYHRLAGADNVKYGQFVKPGHHLKIRADFVRREGRLVTYDGRIDRVEAPVSGAAELGRVLSAGVLIEPVDAGRPGADSLARAARENYARLGANGAWA